MDSRLVFLRPLGLRLKGFSLIELLIVVAIILIIAAIAIPNLLRARIAANESAAVGNMRTINTAEVAYTAAFPSVGYTRLLTDLQTPTGGCTAAPTPTAACLIDATLAAAVDTAHAKSGYFFTLATSAEVGYTLLATPRQQGGTGVKNFYTDGSGVIRFNPGNPATVSSDAIQ